MKKTKPPKRTANDLSKAKTANIEAMWDRYMVMLPGQERADLLTEILALRASGVVSLEKTDDDAEDD